VSVSDRRGGSPTSSSGGDARDDDDEEEEDEDERRALRSEMEALTRALASAEGENRAMKRFLKDYGMTWVGEPDRGGGAGDEERRGGAIDGRRPRERKVKSTRLERRAAAAREERVDGGGAPGAGAGRKLGSRGDAKSRSRSPPSDEDATAPASVPYGAAPASPPPSRRASAAAKASMSSATEKAATTTTTTEKETKSVRGGGGGGGGGDAYAVDMTKLLKSLKELNHAAGDGKGVVQQSSNGERKLVMPSALPLTLFKDGFILRDGPFRAFDGGGDPARGKSNRAFVTDLVDGYFPSEMKHTHPEGVPFKLIDKTSEAFDPGFKAFSGVAARLDGVVDGVGAKAAYHVGRRGHGGEGKTAAFLAKLPEKVIRDGNVIDVRGDIAAYCGSKPGGGGGGGVVDLDTTCRREHFIAGMAAAAAKTNDGSVYEPSRRPAVSPNEVTTLRVKGMDGRRMYALTLRASDTVGKLRAYLKRATEEDEDDKNVGLGFEIRGAYPPRAYADDDETLMEAGLVPNAALLLKPIPL